ncbi:hypothetical protein [Rhodococcoides fascians]|uniref:hypothetical protein n=1 Tax=Rhodococcoides fascians TaxID=1828 RepID=UPI0005687D47|nr:hypothetical protein [Rhodococcus fascians]
MQRDSARPVVIARTIGEGKKYIAETPSVPVNTLVIVDGNALRGLSISELHWAPGWELRRSPEKRRLLETSARAHLTAPRYEGNIIDGFINIFPDLFKKPVAA